MRLAVQVGSEFRAYSQACKRIPPPLPARRKRIYLVNAEEIWPLNGRRDVPREERNADVEQWIHLRFQRTRPSFVSSSIIPRSASSLRMRSAAAKSRFCFAMFRSVMSVSISVSLSPLASPP